jgi:ribosomal-protein-alanine N-acetyltransferase
MRLDDIDQVLEVDRESYTLPWPATAYRREILHNRNARYFVLRRIPEHTDVEILTPASDHRLRTPWGFFRRPLKDESANGAAQLGGIVGYAGMWLMVDEAHITTIAVRTHLRGKGLGELLLARLLEAAIDEGVRRVTLEVRVSNNNAQNLYRKYGFRQEGIRPRYYSDNNEDAYIMSTGSVTDSDYLEAFEDLVRSLHRRFSQSDDISVASGVGTISPDSA